jgi:hypothetical protein
MALMLVACVVGGIVITCMGFASAFEAWASRSWPLAGGHIVSSQVLTESDERGKPSYRPAIRYTYEVAGQTLEGTRVWTEDGVSWPDRSPAQRVVDRYPAGQAVSVAYDAANPKRALLEPGFQLTTFTAVALGLFMALGSLVVLISQLPLLVRRQGRGAW